MSIPADVFPFTLSLPCRERFTREAVYLASNDGAGASSRRVRVPFSAYVVTADVVFPQPPAVALTARDLLDWDEDRSGPVDPFLLSPKDYDHRHVNESLSWDGATGMLLKYKHIVATSIVVTVAGSPRTPTLSGNNTAPSLTISGGAGTALVAYDILVPVYHDTPALDHSMVVPGNDDAHRGAKRYTVSMRETDPGARYSPAYRSLFGL